MEFRWAHTSITYKNVCCAMLAIPNQEGPILGMLLREYRDPRKIGLRRTPPHASSQPKLDVTNQPCWPFSSDLYLPGSLGLPISKCAVMFFGSCDPSLTTTDKSPGAPESRDGWIHASDYQDSWFEDRTVRIGFCQKCSHLLNSCKLVTPTVSCRT